MVEPQIVDLAVAGSNPVGHPNPFPFPKFSEPAHFIAMSSSPVATFSFPTTTVFGPGTLAELPARLKSLGCQRPLVVTDPGLIPTRAFQRLTQVLGEKAGESPQGESFFSYWAMQSADYSF